MDASSPFSLVKVREAIKAAKQFVLDVYADVQLEDVLLEEVRPDGNSWLITIGFRDPAADLHVKDDPRFVDPNGEPWDAARERGFIRWPRLYKVVRVDGQFGHATAMTDRAA